MSETLITILTPASSGAIATLEVLGPAAWPIARELFRPAGKHPLPEQPPLHRFWFGKLADGDEVILTVKQTEPVPRIEIHCHGGRRIVQWAANALAGCGFPTRIAHQPDLPLLHAPTLRTASILLDQYHGAFESEVHALLADCDPDRLKDLASFAPLGRHLVQPWKVAIVGPPNVGKSSLVNAIVGFARSVTSEIPGTTRDVVTVQVALDGWPVELADTAGRREASGLEAAGIAMADQYIRGVDLVVEVIDGADPMAPESHERPELRVLNKCDLPLASMDSRFTSALRVSAFTGEGIPTLIAAIVSRLIPRVPAPGAAVPYTPELADRVERAAAEPERAPRHLSACL